MTPDDGLEVQYGLRRTANPRIIEYDNGSGVWNAVVMTDGMTIDVTVPDGTKFIFDTTGALHIDPAPYVSA